MNVHLHSHIFSFSLRLTCKLYISDIVTRISLMKRADCRRLKCTDTGSAASILAHTSRMSDIVLNLRSLLFHCKVILFDKNDIFYAHLWSPQEPAPCVTPAATQCGGNRALSTVSKGRAFESSTSAPLHLRKNLFLSAKRADHRQSVHSMQLLR